MQPIVRLAGPVDPIAKSDEAPTSHPLPPEIAEKIRAAAYAFVRAEGERFEAEDLVREMVERVESETAKQDDEDEPEAQAPLVLTNPRFTREEISDADTDAILNEIDADALIRMVLSKDEGFTEEAIRALVRAEVAKAAEEARLAEQARLRAEERAEQAAQTRRQPTPEELKRAERRRLAAEEAMRDIEAARERDREAEARARRIHDDMLRDAAPQTVAPAATAAAFAGTPSGTDPDADAPLAPDWPDTFPGEAPARPAAPAQVNRAAALAPPRNWDTPKDHEMGSLGRMAWRVAIYGPVIFFPAFLMLTSPYSPTDTLAHHLTGMSCGFAPAMGTADAQIGEPGYHARFDADGDGISCETPQAQLPAAAAAPQQRRSAGGARFISAN